MHRKNRSTEARCERWHVEHRMIRHGKFVHRQHAEHSAERGQQNGALKRDRDERRPAIERAAADIVRIGDHAIHHSKEKPPMQPANPPIRTTTETQLR